MSTIDTETRSTRGPFALLATAGVLIALAIAGCGGPGKVSPSASGAAPAARNYSAPPEASANGSAQMPSAPSTKSKTPAASDEAGGIPQNNSGDQDADNNGGPSDGDGNV